MWRLFYWVKGWSVSLLDLWNTRGALRAGAMTVAWQKHYISPRGKWLRVRFRPLTSSWWVVGLPGVEGCSFRWCLCRCPFCPDSLLTPPIRSHSLLLWVCGACPWLSVSSEDSASYEENLAVQPELLFTLFFVVDEAWGFVLLINLPFSPCFPGLGYLSAVSLEGLCQSLSARVCLSPSALSGGPCPG